MLRGIALVLMALDHSWAMAGLSLVAESYGGVRPELRQFPFVLLGLITNIASCVFFTLAGTSMAFFEASRLKRGWSQGRVTRFFLTRAAILWMLDILIEPAAWNSPVTFDTLSSIAFCIAVLAFARRLSLKQIAIVAALLFLGYPLLVTAIGQPDPTTPLGYVATVLLQYHADSPPYVEFPALARLSLVLGGYVWGVLLYRKQATINTRLVWVGMGGLVVTLVLRLLGGYGNFLPYQPDWPLIYFFIENKEPPSIVFLLFNMSLAAFLLVALDQWRSLLERMRIGTVLTLFGQTSLFFYVMHLLLYSKLVVPFFDVHTLPMATETHFVEFGVGIVIMIPLCVGYRWLRRRYPGSVLQYL